MRGEIRVLRQHLQEDRAAGAGDAADIDRLRHSDAIDIIRDDPALEITQRDPKARAPPDEVT
jgi:hypothetical protein